MSARRAPLIYQSADADCGPTCLRIVAAHHGTELSAATAAALTETDRDGCTAADLIRGATAIGLVGRGVRMPTRAFADFVLPAIAVLGTDHFVVVEAVTATDVLVNDPAIGRHRVLVDAFAADFTGIALVFTRSAPATHTADAAGPASSGVIARRIRTWLTGCGRGVFLVICCGVVDGLATAATVTAAVAHPPFVVALFALGAMSVLVGSRSLRGMAVQALTRTIEGRAVLRWFAALLDTPGSTLRLVPAPVALARLSMVQSAAPLLVHRLVVPASDTLGALVVWGVLAAIAPISTLIGLFACLVSATSVLLAERRSVDDRRVFANEMSRRHGMAIAMVAARVDEPGPHHTRLSEAFASSLARECDARTRVVTAHAPHRAGSLTVMLLLPLVVAVAPHTSLMLSAVVVAVAAITARAIAACGGIGEFVERLAIVDSEPIPTDPASVPHDEPAATRDAITVTGAGMCDACDGSTIHVAHGRFAILEGDGAIEVLAAAAGATRRADIEATVGGRRPTGRMDDVDSRTGLLTERFAVFAGTVHDNVTLFDDAISESDVHAALVATGADELDPDLVVTAHGHDLARSQRRQVALARAIVRRPIALVLMHPTAGSSDAEAEHTLTAARAHGAAVLCVSDDPRVIDHADEVLTCHPCVRTAKASSDV
ncbi:MAG: cysteine peptidase family C39 domain-containing protein [Rhodococcus sp. (in: high G+C Gram-positive bacteria)]